MTPAGLPKTEVDPNGAATSYRYDRTGDLREMTDRAGLVTQYTYDELGRRISTTVISDVFPDGVVTLTGFDALGNVVRETGPPVTNEITGHVHRLQTTTVFDPARNRVSITESDIGGSPEADAPRVTTYAYDDADRIVEISDPEGGVATTTYDAAGHAVSMTDPAGRRVDYTYDDNNRPVSATGIGLVADEGGQPRNVNFGSLVYDPGGRPIQRTDALGRSTTIAYDAADRPVSTTLIGYVNRDGTSRDIVLEATTYDAAGNPTEVVAGGGRRNTVHTHDEAGRRVATTLDPTGVNRTTTSIFDPNGNVITSTRSDGTTIEQTRYGYDAADRLLETIIENGDDDLTTTYTYDERGVLTSTVDPRGTTPTADPAIYRVDYTADELSRVVRTESPPVTVTDNGATTTGQRPAIVTGYDTFGSPTHTLDERAHTTTRRYDRLGREVQILHPSYTVPSSGTTLTPTETFTYDPVGNLTSRTDRRGRATNYIFDGLNRRTTQTDPPLGTEPAGVWRWFYDDTGNTVTTVDPRGARTEATYDALNRQRTRTAVVRNATPTADRFTTTFDYDDLGNPVYEQSPTGDITTTVFSAASEPLTVTDATGNTTSHAYDVAGRRTVTTDPLGRSTQTTYDGAGRAVATDRYSPTGTLVTSTTNGYDPAGNLISITSPRGNAAGANTQDFTTTFEFDPIGRLSAVTEPVDAATSITTQYGYDAAGNQTVLTDGRGNTTRYGYNAWNLQTQVIEPATTAHPNLADRTWTNEFDAGGLPVRSTEPGGVEIARSFDELGRLVNESGSGPDAPTATRQFGYDAAGLMTGASSPTGTIQFTYDDRRLLTNSAGPAAYTGSYAYDPAGRLITRTSAAGSTTITWNPRNLPATVTDSLTNTTATHTYNPAGQLSATTYSSGATRTYDYDTLGRLTADTLRTADGTITAAHQVGYDLDSNIVERTDTLPGNSAAGTNTYTYDNLGRLTSWTQPGASTPQAFEWDPAGNLTLNADAPQTFDERNRINTAGTTTYTWTPRSTMATQQPGASPAVTFTFDGLGRRTSVNADTYSYDSLDRVATRNTDQFSYTGTDIDPTQIGATRFSRGVNGELIATQTSTDPASLIGLNPHGDVSYLFDNTATVASTRTYDPLGATTATSGTQPVVGFQGDYTDPTTNDIWMGARWYQPGTGNFASRDTIFGKLETPISLNRFTYAHGDPLGMWDPDGRRAESRDICNAFGQELSNEDLLALAEGGGARGCTAKRASTVVSDAIHGTVTFAAAGVASLGCAAAAGAVSGANPVAMGAAAGFCGGATQRAVTTLFAGGSLAEAGTAAISPRAAFVDTVGGAIGGGLFQRLGGLNPSLSRSQRAIGGGASFAAEGAARDGISTALNGGSPLQSVFAAGNLQRRFGDVSIGGGLGLASSPNSGPDFDRRVTNASRPNSVTAERLAPNSEVPTVVFSRGRSPGIAQNFDDAVANGAPTRLNRVDAATRDANRRAALRGQSPAPAGQSLDEYPFVCSAQGGCGSFVRSVPVEEQSYQGGVLSQFFQRNDMRPGDPFDVVFGP